MLWDRDTYMGLDPECCPVNKSDVLKFEVIDSEAGNRTLLYTVCPGYCSNNSGGPNCEIFSYIEDAQEDTQKFCRLGYGYDENSGHLNGDWPECDRDDWKALTKLIIKIFKSLYNHSGSRPFKETDTSLLIKL